MDRKNTRYVVYEGVFVNNDEVKTMFRQLRGEPLYALVPTDFHVTSSFLPTKDHRELYGQEVTVKVFGYKNSAILDDNGQLTHNEGVAVTLTADNPTLQAHLNSQSANWHITGSSEHAHKYAGRIDFSDGATPVNITLKGVFGAFLNGGSVVFDATDVDTPMENVVNL